MHKIVLDTNVLISSLISRSYPYLIVNKLILDQKVSLLISNEVLKEYKEVIKRSKFLSYPNFSGFSSETLNAIEKDADHCKPNITLDFLRDLSDNRFLELAVFAEADFLITGNSNHFPFRKFESFEIISPEKYWNTYWK